MGVLLECRNLTKRYGRVAAVNNLTLTMGSGRIIGLLGPNGSGKTTLIKMINGLLTPTSGEIYILGEKPGVLTHEIVSYLPDKNYLNKRLKAGQVLDYFEDFYEDFNRSKALHMLEDLQISLIFSTNLLILFLEGLTRETWSLYLLQLKPLRFSHF